MAKIQAIGKRIIEACETDDKAKLAKILGFKTVQGVYKVLYGESELDFDKLVRFKNYTKRSIDWLLTGEDDFPVREFDVVRSIEQHDDWLDVISDWYAFESRPNPMPDTMGASFMGGWSSFDLEQKVNAIRDFKNFLDAIGRDDS